MTKKQYLGLLLIIPLLTVSVASTFTTISPANALIKRDYYYLNDQHLTARYGNTAVCGDHLCMPGEWEKLQASLESAQLGYQGGRNATQSTMTAVPSTSVSSMQEPSMTAPEHAMTTPQDLGSVLRLSNANLPL